jgi:mannose-6-phosphate isomerase-like protein (cupin superfamily)
MIRRKGSCRVEQIPNLRGGKGTILMEHLLEKEDFAQTGRLFAVTTLRPGCSIGEHTHQGDFEVYAIVSGQGLFTDNGQAAVMVGPGDVCLTRNGESHALENTGTEDLVMTAVVIYAREA